jgi:hypothetical protein
VPAAIKPATLPSPLRTHSADTVPRMPTPPPLALRRALGMVAMRSTGPVPVPGREASK